MKHHKYGAASMKKLLTVHPDLRRVAIRALQMSPYDITIVHGWRGEEVQNALFDSGASHSRFPQSKHNATGPDGKPRSLAIDFAPWVGGNIPWNETHIFAAVAGCFIAVANANGVKLRWGGDWNGNGLTDDQTLMDWGHLELVE